MARQKVNSRKVVISEQQLVNLVRNTLRNEDMRAIYENPDRDPASANYQCRKYVKRILDRALEAGIIIPEPGESLADKERRIVHVYKDRVRAGDLPPREEIEDFPVDMLLELLSVKLAPHPSETWSKFVQEEYWVWRTRVLTLIFEAAPNG